MLHFAVVVVYGEKVISLERRNVRVRGDRKIKEGRKKGQNRSAMR